MSCGSTPLFIPGDQEWKEGEEREHSDPELLAHPLATPLPEILIGELPIKNASNYITKVLTLKFGNTKENNNQRKIRVYDQDIRRIVIQIWRSGAYLTPEQIHQNAAQIIIDQISDLYETVENNSKLDPEIEKYTSLGLRATGSIKIKEKKRSSGFFWIY